MSSFPRMLLVAAALLASGAPQVLAALGDDACCAEEGDLSGPGCPPGLSCVCCPMRIAPDAGAPSLAPAVAPGVAVSVAVAEPVADATPACVFQPPRA